MIARSLVFLGLATTLVAAVPRAAAAETWPDRPLTMVVPFPPGGPTDALGRILSERMGRALGQSIIVDNVSGAGGTLGVAKVARAPADGYTLSIAQTTSNVFSVAVYNVPYDVLADFEPVALISSSALMMIGRADLPASNLRELIAVAEGCPASRVVRDGRRRQPGPCVGPPVRGLDRGAAAADPLPRRGARHAGPGGRPHRPVGARGLEHAALCAGRQDQGLRRPDAVALAGGAGHPDARRTGPAGTRRCRTGRDCG